MGREGRRGEYLHAGRGLLGGEPIGTMGEEFCHVEADTASSDDGDALAHLMREAINEDEGGHQRR